jgi:hypothetical protein
MQARYWLDLGVGVGMGAVRCGDVGMLKRGGWLEYLA